MLIENGPISIDYRGHAHTGKEYWTFRTNIKFTSGKPDKPEGLDVGSEVKFAVGTAKNDSDTLYILATEKGKEKEYNFLIVKHGLSN